MFINFGGLLLILIHLPLSLVSKRFNQELESVEMVILCINIGDVHQFTSHCFIHLDPQLMKDYMYVYEIS